MFTEKYIFEQTPGILVKFCHSSDLRLWRTGMLLFTKTKGHMSNVHYSGFPKHLQTKSNLHISISQSKLKHKCLPLDTLQSSWHQGLLSQVGQSHEEISYFQNHKSHVQVSNFHKALHFPKIAEGLTFLKNLGRNYATSKSAYAHALHSQLIFFNLPKECFCQNCHLKYCRFCYQRLLRKICYWIMYHCKRCIFIQFSDKIRLQTS